MSRSDRRRGLTSCGVHARSWRRPQSAAAEAAAVLERQMPIS